MDQKHFTAAGTALPDLKDDMRITDVTLELVDLPAQPAFRWRAGLPGSEGPVVGGILRIHTDEGLTGEARTRRGRIVADLVERRIRADLIDADPLWRELLWHRLWELDRIEELPIYALGLVDVALWDLAGKALQLPVYQLLGGKFRDKVRVYCDTALYQRNLPTAADFAEASACSTVSTVTELVC